MCRLWIFRTESGFRRLFGRIWWIINYHMSHVGWRNFDWLLLSCRACSVPVGIAMIYSATITTIDLSELLVTPVALCGSRSCHADVGGTL